MFVNSTEKIWTYNTTLNLGYICKMDLMCNITNDYIFFNRSYYMNHTYSKILKGTFDRDNINQMMVAMPGMEVQTVEELIYSTANYSCGIFYVTSGMASTGWYELRFKDYMDTDEPDMACVKYFEALRIPGSVLYNKWCKTLFLPKKLRD
uniref:Putative lipocalin-3 1 n=1 Tax=Amblyomma triste TaxID=251400 RepID=A0A023G6X9_AMBTT